MSVSGIGNFGASAYQAPTASKNQSVNVGTPSVENEFLAYMKKSPGERMIDAWLKAHHLTQDDLKKMSPEKREAIEKQMAEDIKNEMKRKAGIQFDILA